MDALEAVLVELDKHDQLWSGKLRADAFDNDRTRLQAVGRVKMIDAIRQFVADLRKKQSVGDIDEEEIDE